MIDKGADTALSSSRFHNVQSLFIVKGATVKVKGIKGNPIPAKDGRPLNALKLQHPLVVSIRSHLYIHDCVGEDNAI
jgi:hypothetical protein